MLECFHIDFLFVLQEVRKLAVAALPKKLGSDAKHPAQSVQSIDFIRVFSPAQVRCTKQGNFPDVPLNTHKTLQCLHLDCDLSLKDTVY